MGFNFSVLSASRGMGMDQADANQGRPKWRPWTIVSLILMFASTNTIAHSQGMAGSHHVAPPRNGGNSTMVKTDISLEDIAAAAGLTFKHESGDPINKKFLLESIGSGAAIFDYDGDGMQDIFLVNATVWNSFATKAPPTSRLYKNLGNLKFEDVTAKAGLIHTGWGQGVCTGDYRQRRARGHAGHLLRPQYPLPQQRKRDLYRRHCPIRPSGSGIPVGHRMLILRL